MFWKKLEKCKKKFVYSPSYKHFEPLDDCSFLACKESDMINFPTLEINQFFYKDLQLFRFES